MTAFTRRLVELCSALRDAGLPLGLEQTTALARSTEWINVLSRTEFYFAARATLVTRRVDLQVFDETFARLFGGQPAESNPRSMPRAPRHGPNVSLRPVMAPLLSEKAQSGDPEVELLDRAHTASTTEVFQHKDFSLLSAAERAALVAAMRLIRWQMAQRKTRRRVAARRGEQIDLRRAMAQAARTSGTIISLPKRRRKIKNRPLVLIADLSGSMEVYARILLQFFHVVSRSHRGTEAFVFGTRLTRITSELKLRDIDESLDRATSQIIDYGGGTRIGESLAQFNRIWGRRVLRRGAVVVVISDGCERGDLGLLAREMRRLRDRSHRLVWLNPRLGAAGYEPLVQGMATAFPYVDDFLPIHNLQALSQLADHLSQLPARRTGGLH